MTDTTPQGVAQRVLAGYDDSALPHNLMLQLQRRGAERMYRELSREARRILAELEQGYRHGDLAESKVNSDAYGYLRAAFTRLGLDEPNGADDE